MGFMRSGLVLGFAAAFSTSFAWRIEQFYLHVGRDMAGSRANNRVALVWSQSGGHMDEC
jgi:hypothetical protein